MSDKEAADTVKIFSFLEFNVILHFSITHSGKKPSHISAVQKTPKEAGPLKENAFRTQCWVWLESLKEFSKKKKKVDLEREEVFVHLKQKLSTLFSF